MISSLLFGLLGGVLGFIFIGNLRDDEAEAPRWFWVALTTLLFGVVSWFCTGDKLLTLLCIAVFAAVLTMGHGPVLRGPKQHVNFSDDDFILKAILRVSGVKASQHPVVMGYPVWLAYGLVRYGTLGLLAIPLQNPWFSIAGVAWWGSYALSHYLFPKVPAKFQKFIAEQSVKRNETSVFSAFVGGFVVFFLAGLGL